MLTRGENIAVLLIVMPLAMLFLAGLNRLWPRSKREAHNNLIGWQLGLIGTTYAVILGFMLYTVWTTFGEANLNTDLEANALRNLDHLAAGLPTPQREHMGQLCRDYAAAVITNDWPEMYRHQVPEESHALNQEMWRTLMSVKTASPTELIAEDHAITELSDLTQHRRTRLLQSTYHLPTIFWCILIIGGMLTILSASLFGSANSTLHAVQVFSFTLLIVLALLAIADVNLPFRGWVRVSNYAFVRAQQNMQE